MTTPPPESFQLVDITLRKGVLQEGIRLSIPEKLQIISLLDGLGIDFIDVGSPATHQQDKSIFEAIEKELVLHNTKLIASGSVCRPGRRPADDRKIQALLELNVETIGLDVFANGIHIEQAAGISLKDNLDSLSETVQYLVEQDRRVLVNCEHFFNGYQSDSAYAVEVVRSAAEAGSDLIVLCDTNGSMLPNYMGDAVSAAAAIGADLGIQCYDDTGCAVANTLAAVDAGAIQVQGTINGYGERTGSVDLITVIANLQLKYGWSLLPAEKLADLTRISHTISSITHQPINYHQPYVGLSSFARKKSEPHKGNIELYQHIDPALVGNDLRMLVSDKVGRTNIRYKGKELGFELLDRDFVGRFTEVVKQRVTKGYNYETAEASFELLLRHELGILRMPIQNIMWQVCSSFSSGQNTNSKAEVAVRYEDEKHYESAEGNGPLNALDNALRGALAVKYPVVQEFDLTDYMTRVLDGSSGTCARVRVIIEINYKGHIWTTVGVGENILEASWEALSDAYNYGLIKYIENEDSC